MIAQTTPSIQVTCCRRCGRKLSNPRSAERGIGPTCARRVKAIAIVEPATAAEPAPVIVALAPHTRRSNAVAGLMLEYDGAGYLTFKLGRWFTVYRVLGGQAVEIDCSDRGIAPLAAYRVMGKVARAYAAKLAGKVVA